MTTLRLVLFLIFSFFSMVLNAQGEHFYFHCNKGEHLESALQKFAAQNDIKLSYPAYIMDQIYPGELSLTSPDLEKLLYQVLHPSHIEYKILAGQKVLLRKVVSHEMELVDADNIIILQGSITSANDYTPLELATVSVPNLKVGTYTDENGNYSLKISKHAIDEKVVISYIGYESINYTVKDLINQKMISLLSSSSEIDAVVVQGSRSMIVINTLSAGTELKLKNILSIGSSTIQGNDLLRKLQFLPGIAATDDKSSSIKIRGGDDSETLVLIDGIPIYKTDHFYGIFGNVNGSYIDDVILYKNELPISQSGKSGGLVSMTSPQNIDRFKGSAKIDLLNSSVNLGMPIDKNWNFFLAGRASYNNVANAGFFEKNSGIRDVNMADFNRPTVLGVTPSFDFYDFNGKLAYKNKDLLVNVNYFRSYDELSSYFENTFTTRFPRGSNRRVTNEEVFSNDESWENEGVSVNLLTKMNKEWTISSTSYYTRYSDQGNLSFSVISDVPDNPLNTNIKNENKNRIEDLSSTLMVSKKLMKTDFSFGIKYIDHQNNLEIGQDGSFVLENIQKSREMGAFTSFNYRIRNDLIVHAGIRATHYNQSNKLYYAPQLSLAYRPTDKFSIKASTSINYQYVRELTYSNRFGEELEVFTLSDGKRLSVGASYNYMVGGVYKNNNWLVDVEFYNIERENVLNFTTFLPQIANNNNQENERKFKLINGQGHTSGMDLMLSYQAKNYAGILSYTLSKSENNYKEIFRNQPFAAQDDRRHQFTFTNTYKYQKWAFSGNAVYSSGRRYTDLTKVAAGLDRRNNSAKDFESTLPYYMRFDLSLDYKFDFKKNKLKFGISVLNILNRSNVKYLQFTAKLPSNQNGGNPNGRQDVLGIQTNQLDRTLNLSFGIEF
ncbi:MAG: TonB-dependent receptor [Saprospiraceae bacterium]